MLTDVFYRTFPGFNPQSATLLGPAAVVGTCLRGSGFAEGCTLVFGDFAVEPCDGDIVLVRLEVLDADPPVLSTYTTKRLQYDERNDEWRLESDDGGVRFDDIAEALQPLTDLLPSSVRMVPISSP